MPGRGRQRGRGQETAGGKGGERRGGGGGQKSNSELLDIAFGRNGAPVSDVSRRNVDSALLDQGRPGPAPEAVPGRTGEVYREHVGNVGSLHDNMSEQQRAELSVFKRHYDANKGRYQAVAARTGIPAALIAAIHWRESSGNFGTYLHQGDPLGKPAVHVPTNIPVFTRWEDAAVHALTMSDKAQVRDDLQMTAETSDAASMATFAEFYNGLGYHNRDRASPYVYSGTDEYQGGKYVADGQFSATAMDRQLGVLTMVDAVGGMNEDIAGPDWSTVASGRTILRQGTSGPLVEELQRRLAAKGFACGDDGVFGPTVFGAVKRFQQSIGLGPDGVVGRDTAARL